MLRWTIIIEFCYCLCIPPTVQVVISRVHFKRYSSFKSVAVKLHSAPWLRFRSRVYQCHSSVETLPTYGSREPSKQSSRLICNGIISVTRDDAKIETYHDIALGILTLKINIDCIDSFGVKNVSVIIASVHHPPHTSMVIGAKCTHRDWTTFSGCIIKKIMK